MSYQQGGKIEAADINTHINSVNSVLSDKGLNTLSTVAAGQTVRASDWAGVTGAVANLASHHGATTTLVGTPTSGGTASFISALTTNISNVSNAKRNARLQGTEVPYSIAAGRWARAITVTQTVAFASASAAQYFFNAGGQIAIQYTHPSGTGIDGVFNALATACGTLVISSPNSGTINVGSTSYSGFQRVGGSGTPTPYLTNAGYYGLSTTSQTMFKLLGGSYTNPVPGGGVYSANYIQLDAYTSSAGATINLVSTWSESTTGGLLTTAGSTTKVIIRPPSTSDISGFYSSVPWGTITVTSNPIVGS
jgi:hypothetical protein